MRPRPTAGRPSRAPDAATRRAQASATSSPPPNAKPFSAAIVGTGREASELRTSWPESEASRPANTSPPSAVNSLMSAPATKARPAPVRTSACTPSEPATTSRASPNSSMRSELRALRTSGRSKVMTATPSSVPKAMLSNSRSPSSWISCWSLMVSAFLCVIVKTCSGFPAEPAGAHQLPQERMHPELRVLELGVQAFSCGKGDVEAHQVAQGERSERHVRSEFHGPVDVGRAGHPLSQDVHGVIQVGDEQAVDDEAGRVVAGDGCFAQSFHESG